MAGTTLVIALGMAVLAGGKPATADATSRADGPLTRTTPMPPRPGGVAIATIVSSGEYMKYCGVLGFRVLEF